MNIINHSIILETSFTGGSPPTKPFNPDATEFLPTGASEQAKQAVPKQFWFYTLPQLPPVPQQHFELPGNAQHIPAQAPQIITQNVVTAQRVISKCT